MEKENIVNNSQEQKKRKARTQSDQVKRLKNDITDFTRDGDAGKVQRVWVRNFMCHDSLEVNFNSNVNFIVGRNGSGKSAILTALTVGLGAKAAVTSRGTALKNFVKKGKASAAIEITLSNTGPMGYKPEKYGEKIVVHRTIGASSSYKLKNARGTVISTKREELDNILIALNIQVDNPISILNQDLSRTFLISSKPEDKYQLFMKATRLNIIGDNYKDAQHSSHMVEQRLRQVKLELTETENELKYLEECLDKMREIGKSRQQVTELQMELLWAKVVSEERKVKLIEETMQESREQLRKFEEEGSSTDSRLEDIDTSIRKIQEKIEQLKSELDESNQKYENIKQERNTANGQHSVKAQEWKSCQNKIKHYEDNVKLLRREIQRIENSDNEEQKKKKDMARELENSEHKLDEIEALLRTKKTDQMHLENERSILEKDRNRQSAEKDRWERSSREIRQKLSQIKQQSDNTYTVFGRNIPRLLNRIKEEYERGKLKELSRGPLGANIKMKDSTWAPAVESFLGYGTLATFCVDNSNDAKHLNVILKEIYHNERPPQIICSKFHNRVHDVRRYSTRTDIPGLSSLLDAMVISDPVVANCLIDQREVECIMLIPTSKQASEIMSSQRKVPSNCKRALTQRGDTFFPDPNYRSYGGNCGSRAKILQVSTSQAIENLEEELTQTKEKYDTAVREYNATNEKYRRIDAELTQVNSQVMKLRDVEQKLNTDIVSLKHKISTSENLSVATFKEELKELENKLKEEREKEGKLREQVEQLLANVRKLEREYIKCKDGLIIVQGKIQPLRDQIKVLEQEKSSIEIEGRNATKRLANARLAVKELENQHAYKKKMVDQEVAAAEETCPRRDVRRSIHEIDKNLRDLENKIRAIERQLGSEEDLQARYDEKMTEYIKIADIIKSLETCNRQQLERLGTRCDSYKQMKKSIGLRVQEAFQAILSIRKYKGHLRIDHVNQTLTIVVSPDSNAQKSTGNTNTLSGGERSYSTVAFILALWDCTGLPFYFLDEFDVFMDKVNRRVIMDILLDHTRSHPQSQFAFLTPLDTSDIEVDDYITIHQLAPPKRGYQGDESQQS